MIENDILFSAIDNLKQWIQLPIKVRLTNQNRRDTEVTIGRGNKFQVEVKKELHASNLASILDKVEFSISENPLLVAQTISKSAKEILKQKNISYLDRAGNCFIENNRGLYIHIDGKKLEGANGMRKHSAFNKNGIKLILALLLDKELVNQPYSEMALAGNIAKSTIGNILEDLKEKNFLINVNSKIRKLTNKKELLEKWVYSYNEKMKPSILRGKFRFIAGRLTEWKKMDLGVDTYWGGEPAADILTDYLSPGEWSIYTNRSRNDIAKNLQLVPDSLEGNVEVYDIFWNTQKSYFADDVRQNVNPIIIYADLIGTNNNRNFETARKIYEREISTNIIE